MSSRSTRELRMDARREKRFMRHGITIREEKREEERIVDGKLQTVQLTHCVSTSKLGEDARTTSHRQALKRAHQMARTLERRKKGSR